MVCGDVCVEVVVGGNWVGSGVLWGCGVCDWTCGCLSAWICALLFWRKWRLEAAGLGA